MRKIILFLFVAVFFVGCAHKPKYPTHKYKTTWTVTQSEKFTDIWVVNDSITIRCDYRPTIHDIRYTVYLNGNNTFVYAYHTTCKDKNQLLSYLEGEYEDYLRTHITKMSKPFVY